MVIFFLIIQLVILIFSIVIHEVAHGEMAYFLGDPTAKDMGRLTLNPIKHIDPVGSILLPLITFFLKTGFILGWAKPVPYNPAYLRNQKYGPTLVGMAGPATNISVAIIFGIIARFLPLAQDLKQQINLSVMSANYANASTLINGSPLAAFFAIAILITLINLILAIFNLIPIPPLDGSKLLYLLIPESKRGFLDLLERFGFVFIILLVLYGGTFIFFIMTQIYMLVLGPGMF